LLAPLFGSLQREHSDGASNDHTSKARTKLSSAASERRCASGWASGTRTGSRASWGGGGGA